MYKFYFDNNFNILLIIKPKLIILYNVKGRFAMELRIFHILHDNNRGVHLLVNAFLYFKMSHNKIERFYVLIVFEDFVCSYRPAFNNELCFHLTITSTKCMYGVVRN